MKTASAKAKGRFVQNLVVKEFLKLYPELDVDDIKPAIMGESGLDVKLSPQARIYVHYGVECKNVEDISLWAAYDQAAYNCGKANQNLSTKLPKYDPMVVFKKNGEKPHVALKEQHLPLSFSDPVWSGCGIIRGMKGAVWTAIKEVRLKYPSYKVIELSRTANKKTEFIIIIQWEFFLKVMAEQNRRIKDELKIK